MRACLLALIATMGACTDSESPTLDRYTACQAQAQAWCTAAGYPAGGCAIVYTGTLCAARDLEIPIPADMQAQCIAHITPHAEIPESCEATWPLTR